MTDTNIKDVCNQWTNNPLVNPITKRTIKQGAAKYNELQSLCLSQRTITRKKKEVEKKPTNKPVKSTKQQKSTKKNDDDFQMRRTNTLKILKKELKSIEPCIVFKSDKMQLVNKRGNIVANIKNRIGSASRFGEAYLAELHDGKQIASDSLHHLQFALKIMSSESQEHILETKIMEKCTKYVEKNIFPNLPVTYVIRECKTPCDTDCSTMGVAKSGPYFILCNELANYDLMTWLKTEHSEEDYESVVMQMLLALQFLHATMKYVHNDVTFGNFLIHEVPKGGYWLYRCHGKDIYIPNTGFMLVLWDFGKSVKLVKGGKQTRRSESAKLAFHDFHYSVKSISTIEEQQRYGRKRLVHIPSHIVKKTYTQLVNAIEKTNDHTKIMRTIFDTVSFSYVKIMNMGSSSVVIKHVLNPKNPYIVCEDK